MNATQKIEAAFEQAPVILRRRLISDVRKLSGLDRATFEAGLRELWTAGRFTFEPCHSAFNLGLTSEQTDGWRVGQDKFVWADRS